MSIWKKASYIGKKFLRRTVAGRRLTVLADDVFLTSYPRSGNTWARFLIANLMYRDVPASFTTIEQRIPEIYLFPNRRLLQQPRPRLLKSHEYFDPRYPKVIYLIRDPRDVAVSLYYYSIKRRDIPEDYRMEDFIPRFIAGEFFVSCGTWAEHVSSWIFTRGRAAERFLALKYEDVVENTTAELAKVASFLDRPTDQATLTRAVELSSAKQMRRLEEIQASDWNLTRKTRLNHPFVRSATTGAWQTRLSPAAVAQIETAWGSIMKHLGYRFSVELASRRGSNS